MRRGGEARRWHPPWLSYSFFFSLYLGAASAYLVPCTHSYIPISLFPSYTFALLSRSEARGVEGLRCFPLPPAFLPLLYSETSREEGRGAYHGEVREGRRKGLLFYRRGLRLRPKGNKIPPKSCLSLSLCLSCLGSRTKHLF